MSGPHVDMVDYGSSEDRLEAHLKIHELDVGCLSKIKPIQYRNDHKPPPTCYPSKYPSTHPNLGLRFQLLQIGKEAKLERVELRPLVVGLCDTKITSTSKPCNFLSRYVELPRSTNSCVQPSLYAKAMLEGIATDPELDQLFKLPIHDRGDFLVFIEAKNRLPPVSPSSTSSFQSSSTSSFQSSTSISTNTSAHRAY